MKFFVYGTLKVSGHFAEKFDGARISSQGGIILQMDLFDLCGFPGIVNGDGVVEGEVHEYSYEDVIKCEMDKIEGFMESNPNDSLFKREVKRIHLDDGTWEDCWVYIYNGHVGSFDKRLYALDIASGNEKWHFEAGGAIGSTPLVYDDTVYIGSFDGRFYAVNAADGSLRWQSEIEATSWFWAKPVAYNNVIYAPCLDGKVYILDAENGREVAGAVDLMSQISSSPVMVGDKVIVASQEGKVYFLSTSDNQPRPLFDVGNDGQEIYAPLAASDGVVYIHAQTPKEDFLYAVEVEMGEEAWKPVPLGSK